MNKEIYNAIVNRFFVQLTAEYTRWLFIENPMRTALIIFRWPSAFEYNIGTWVRAIKGKFRLDY